MTRFRTHKRWRPRPGVEPADVAAVVADRIAPHYSRLDPSVTLGLELDTSSGMLIATQSWPSRQHRDERMDGPRFESWWRDYLPILRDWEQLVEFESEWETTVLL